MFSGCSSLSDIKPLYNWDVSNGNNLHGLFAGCSSLSDIKSLQNWNTSNGNDFGSMFCLCSSLSDIKPLKKLECIKWKLFLWYVRWMFIFIRYKIITKLEYIKLKSF